MLGHFATPLNGECRSAALHALVSDPILCGHNRHLHGKPHTTCGYIGAFSSIMTPTGSVGNASARNRGPGPALRRRRAAPAQATSASD